MKNRNILIQCVCLVLVAACLFTTSALSVSLTAEAGRAQLVYTDQAQEGDPPEVAAGIAMGAFRGLFVNYLWMRANKLKEEGKFHEAIELSSAITRLQPRFPRVWAFHAWNMAYNISVATQTVEERWQWVKAGLDLLRKEAIPRNPNDVLLHKELAWIFNHKIQGFADDANRYYKRRMARDWSNILGQPPSLPEDSQKARRIMADWLEPLVKAPDRLEDLYQREVDAKKKAMRAGDDAAALTSKTHELVDQVLATTGLKLDEDFLRFVNIHDSYKSSWYAEQHVIQLTDATHNKALDALMEDKQYAEAWPALLAYVRRRVLMDVYNMEPERMQRCTMHFGPLDWRHASSHAIYWSARGVDEQLERIGDHNFDTLNTDRLVVQAIQELFRSGRIFYDPVTDGYTALLDTNWADAYGDVFDELVARGGVAEDRSIRKGYTMYAAGYENFLRDVIRVYYRMGELDKAEAYYQKLRTAPWINTNDPDKYNEFKFPLRDFVMNQFHDDRISVPQVAAGEVTSSLIDAYYNGLLANNPKRFSSAFQYAQAVHQTYFEKQDKLTPMDKVNRMEEMPKDFGEMAAEVFLALIASGQMDPPQASRIFQQAPPSLQQLAYDELVGRMRASHLPDAAIKLLFPEPAGMEAFRAAHAKDATTSFDKDKTGLQTEKR